MLLTVELDQVAENGERPSSLTYKQNFETPLIDAARAFYDSEGYRVLGDYTFVEFTSYVSIRHQTVAASINSCSNLSLKHNVRGTGNVTNRT